MPAYWWVNHKQTFDQEVGGNYIWSPLTRSDGGRNEFYENMKRVERGDIVFSFADARIQAVGVCVAPAILAPKPDEFGAAGSAWHDQGWQVTVRFKRLNAPVRPKDHMDVLGPLLPDKYSPIRSSGDGNQGAYLASISPAMAVQLIRLIGNEWSGIGLEIGVDTNAAVERAERQVATVIKNRTDIGDTEKQQLIRARRGQGIYRQNLQGFEKICRVTGISNPRHLRASHIKPWRLSSDFEKLDGNNGLLLSPHIDHLFDQGYISFTDTGTLIISPRMDPDVLLRWHIVPDTPGGRFSAGQVLYITFHREFVFKH